MSLSKGSVKFKKILRVEHLNLNDDSRKVILNISRKIVILFISWVILQETRCDNLAASKIRPVNLTCNGRSDTLGIPRDELVMAWQLQGRGFQKSYRLIVFSEEPNKLVFEASHAILFDSGEVVTQSCECRVKLEEPTMRVLWWRVKIWDKNSHSIISEPQRVVLGLDEKKSEWTAEWLIDPTMLEDSVTAPVNIHSYYRKIVNSAQPIRAAFCFVSADDYYKLYLNEKFVGQGPAPSYLDNYNYNTYEVTSFLKNRGSNCLAVHTYYQGLENRVWVSADGKQGLILQLEIQYQDGSCETIVTDDTWRVLTVTTYNDSARYVGYKTQFLENVDGSKLPPYWQRASFDDSQWRKPSSLGRPPLADYHLVPQLTPPLQTVNIFPVMIKKIQPGDYFIDFGRELVGHTGLKLSRGARNERIEIRHAEELTSEGRARFEMRACKPYQEFYTLAGHKHETFQFYDYKGFRYVEILNSPVHIDKQCIWVAARHHPFDENRSHFTCTDQRLVKIWELCKAGIREGSQEVYVDCPTREKGQYLGDTFITGVAHFYASGELLLQKKALMDFARSSKIKPTLLAVAPCTYQQEIADYSLQWILFLEEYYHHSGEGDFVAQMFPVVEELLAGFKQWENAQGLLEKVTPWNLVDWPANLRDDYDNDRAVQGVNTVLNSFYIGALQSAQRLAEIAGNKQRADYYGDRADNAIAAMNRLLIDPHTNLYIDALGSSHSSLHANTLPLYFGFAAPESRSAIIEFIRQKRMSCGVYFSAFVLRALYRSGAADLAYDLLTCSDQHSWMNMIAAGATTPLEAWGPEQKWNTSWCHAWASAPLFIIAEEIMGIRPAVPGWGKISICPQIPNTLHKAQLRLFTKPGFITIQCQQKYHRLAYEVEIPGNVTAVFKLKTPTVVKSVLVDGRIGTLSACDQEFMVDHELLPGRHKIVCWR